ncbi:DUF1365 domain-containing protein [Rhizobium oryzicola]|uniref:DUF1365 family protein n=1 Tax=Rhizobium oryzicola TaxID=1232668 RepID=A0ABT8SQ57_9HYPH|nr:DUF1365 family protein [Rhizobium oryzicola]MDO1580620.1 DUF1365 family protein [Rhizobium oryzicola]
MSSASALYFGEVVHARQRPRAHRLRYSVFSLLLDLDELSALSRRLKLFAYNSWGVFSFWDKDHGNGEPGGLKAWVKTRLAEAGIDTPDLRVTMLCYPRIFGYVFNPLTVYFCRDDSGRLLALLYEVCNTFMERHTYIIPVLGESEGSVKHSCAKAMYVSPFMPMECTYYFDIAPPGERVRVAINETDAEGQLLYASFAGRRAPLHDRMLGRALVTHPLMTIKVMAGIHWEALRLWLKGVPIYRHKKANQPVASSVEQPVVSGGT